MFGLFSRLHSAKTYLVRPAIETDWPQIEWLLVHAHSMRLGLEWQTLEECMGSPLLLLAFDQRDELVGMLVAVQDHVPITWLRTVALTTTCLPFLLEACIETLIGQGARGLAFLGNERWITRKLRQAGSTLINHVITLQYRPQAQIERILENNSAPGLLVRPVTAGDIEAIAQVDRVAFKEMWRYDNSVLRRALDVSPHFVVAYQHGMCVGYQFSTLIQGHTHIVRLAVHPDQQGQGIGKQLLAQAIIFFHSVQSHVLTVNTQEDNLVSQKLYWCFGFEQTGYPLEVWFHPLAISAGGIVGQP